MRADLETNNDSVLISFNINNIWVFRIIRESNNFLGVIFDKTN
jgi:hypothetical protein